MAAIITGRADRHNPRVLCIRRAGCYSSQVTLAELIADPAADLAAIASYLDSLDSATRWTEVGRLDRGQQRALHGKAAGRAIGLAHFVDDGRSEAIHDGRNTLPLPAPLRRFQKYFCRPQDAGSLFGFNEGVTRRFIGPGFFVATEDDGGVVFDYDRRPGAVPPSWPAVVPNTQGLQRFVFNGTHDVVRGVSTHVCIGAVFRGERAMDHYFVLCRRV
jgi:hypothetical protein